MLRFTIAVIGSIALSALTTSSATAQAIDAFCGDHMEITSRLGKTYGESRAGFGLLDDGRMVEIFTSRQGTWSMLVTAPGGVTCLVASGEAWQIPPVASVTEPMV